MARKGRRYEKMRGMRGSHGIAIDKWMAADMRSSDASKANAAERSREALERRLRDLHLQYGHTPERGWVTLGEFKRNASRFGAAAAKAANALYRKVKRGQP